MKIKYNTNTLFFHHYHLQVMSKAHQIIYTAINLGTMVTFALTESDMGFQVDLQHYTAGKCHNRTTGGRNRTLKALL